jgi:hypothetical protein
LLVLDNYEVKEDSIPYGSLSNGGFDVIIGNPPYVDYRSIDINQIEYLIQNYLSTKVKEKWSLFIPFLEKSANLINNFGKFGFIIPNNFLVSEFGYEVRKYLLNNVHINRIVDVSKFNVFGKVSTYPVLFFFQKPYFEDNFIEISYPDKLIDLELCEFRRIKQIEINQETNKYQISTSITKSNLNLIQEIEKNTIKLEKLYSKFIWGTSITGFKDFKIKDVEFEKLTLKDKKKFQKVIQTSDIKRYRIEWQKEYISKSIYSENAIDEFNKDKIVIARVTKNIQATIDMENYYLGKSSLMTGLKINHYYLLGILNSNLINYYYNLKYENTHMSGGYLRYDIPYLKELPIRTIDFSNRSEKQMHDKLVQLVEQMLENQKYLHEAKNDDDKKLYQNICDSLDKQIDQLVYKLYDLTEEEIIILEGE